MSENIIGDIIYEDWVSDLTVEGKAAIKILDAFLEDCENYETVNTELELMTTNDIIDHLMDMGKVDMIIVNIYMWNKGYRNTKVNGKVYWKIWRY